MCGAVIFVFLCVLIMFGYQIEGNDNGSIRLSFDTAAEKSTILDGLFLRALQNYTSAHGHFSRTTDDPFETVPASTATPDDTSPFDPWSVFWYLGSFGGLIAFFLIVSCSEWCCRKRARASAGNNADDAPSLSPSTQTPPPAYDQFAPPSYESMYGIGEKAEFDVYVVPVHVVSPMLEHRIEMASQDSPPSYSATTASASDVNFNAVHSSRLKNCDDLRTASST